MTKILLIAEHNGATINQATARCVGCASEIPDAEIHVAVFAKDGANLASEAAGLTSVDKVILVDNPANAYPIAAVLAPQIVALADAPQGVGAGGPRGRKPLRVAGRMCTRGIPRANKGG